MKDTIAKLRELRAKAERPEEDYILHEKAAVSRAKALYTEAMLEAAPDLLAAAERADYLERENRRLYIDIERRNGDNAELRTEATRLPAIIDDNGLCHYCGTTMNEIVAGGFPDHADDCGNRGSHRAD